ncbi:MAG: Rap1a/Tai family immunity protein [Paracoccaceae bacterium]
MASENHNESWFMRLSGTLVASLALSMAVAQDAAAQQISGNDLYSACQDAEGGVRLGFCVGYLIGATEGQSWGAFLVLNQIAATDGAEEANERINFFLRHCVPADASNQQLRDVAIQYLEQNPASRHLPARGLIWQAYLEAFPCNN